MQNSVTGFDSEVIHKDVIIIGNGPGGISMSAMLSGLIPYLVSTEHPDDMLSTKLRLISNEFTQLNINLVQQDKLLQGLALELEGRSTNPISLLLDALERPFTDLGQDMPALIEWRRDKTREIDHLVLGKSLPGGSWNTIYPSMLTLSLSSWMSLPGIPFIPANNKSSQERAQASDVCQYYQNYVSEMNLEKYFRTGLHVVKVERHNISNNNSDTSNLDNAPGFSTEPVIKKPRNDCTYKPGHICVQSVTSCHCNSSELTTANDSQISSISDSNLTDKRYLKINDKNIFQYCQHTTPCDCFKEQNEIPSTSTKDLDDNTCWLITAIDTSTNEEVKYTCSNLVLAIGTVDIPNRLNLSIEDCDIPWIMHDLTNLDEKLQFLLTEPTDSLDPVLVIGGGLSAVDCIVATRSKNIPVVHVFKTKNNALDKFLSKSLYPEYNDVFEMMTDADNTFPFYTPLPGYVVEQIIPTNRMASILSATGVKIEQKVSYVFILIGSNPSFDFFPPEFSLGIDKNLPVDVRQNPIDYNKLTHAVNGFNDLYAIGSIARDNFVRYIPGGSMAVMTDLYRKKNWTDSLLN